MTTHEAIVHQPGCTHPDHSSRVYCRDAEGNIIYPPSGVGVQSGVTAPDEIRSGLQRVAGFDPSVVGPKPCLPIDEEPHDMPPSFVEELIEANRLAVITTRTRIDALTAMRLDINAEIKDLRAALVALEAAERHFAKLDPDPDPEDDGGES